MLIISSPVAASSVTAREKDNTKQLFGSIAVWQGVVAFSNRRDQHPAKILPCDNVFLLFTSEKIKPCIDLPPGLPSDFTDAMKVFAMLLLMEVNC